MTNLLNLDPEVLVKQKKLKKTSIPDLGRDLKVKIREINTLDQDREVRAEVEIKKRREGIIQDQDQEVEARKDQSILQDLIQITKVIQKERDLNEKRKKVGEFLIFMYF